MSRVELYLRVLVLTQEAAILKAERKYRLSAQFYFLASKILEDLGDQTLADAMFHQSVINNLK